MTTKPLLLFLALIPLPALAANYVVSPTGNDAAPGTAAAPWKTLQHAANRAKPGDTITVRPGQYAGFVIGWDSPRKIAPSTPITFKADPGAVIIFRNPKTPDAINLEGASNIIIDGFTIDPATPIRAGIRSVQNSNVIIRNNTIDHAGSWGIFTSFSNGVRIENNSTSNSAKEHGIYVSNTTANPVIRGNRSFSNHGCGIHLNGDASQGSAGVITNAIIENNIVYDNGRRGGSGINCDGVQNSVIRNNLLYNNHAAGISLYRIDAAQPSTGNLLINNTVLCAPDARWAIAIKNASADNTLRNNILLHLGTAKGAINISADSLKGFSSNHNILTDRLSPDDDNTLRLPAWRQATGQDKDSLLATPAQLFLNPAKDDYRLLPNSPAIAAGNPEKAPETDCADIPRPRADKPDVGAYAFRPTIKQQ